MHKKMEGKMMLSALETFKTINRFRESAPVQVEELIKALGLKYEEQELDDEISGILKKDNGSYTIVVNSLHKPTRRRFTAAHELGHYILHRDKLGSGVLDSKAYRTNNRTTCYNPNIKQKEETEANQFAANLLMPFDLIKGLQNQGVNSSALLAERLQVSEQAMRIRLETMDNNESENKRP